MIIAVSGFEIRGPLLFLPSTMSTITNQGQQAPYKPALLVIDVQNDFVSGSLAVPGGATVIEPINQLLQLPFALKVATRDYHPSDHVSFASTHKLPVLSKLLIYHPEDLDKVEGLEQVLWPTHCVQNTDGANFAPGLQTTGFDQVITKGVHPNIESYSAFSDIWKRYDSELPGLLKQHGVTDVYVTGLAGDYCVRETAIDSIERGYRTWLVMDAVKSIKPGDDAYIYVHEKGIHKTTTKELTDRLLAN